MRLCLIGLLVFLCGCAFIYDSRNQNSLNALNPSYKLATADKVVVKTGRLIIINLLKKQTGVEKCLEK